MPEILAIIPARGGSKGIPRKNIVDLGGKPLIAYSIELALATPQISRTIVSSEDSEILQVAEEWGAEVPFVRPSELSADHIGDRPVFRHALHTLRRNEGYFPDFVLLLRPPCPFREVEDMQRVIAKWVETKADSVRSVSRVEGVHHPYWMFTMNEEGYAEPAVPGKTIDEFYMRQLLPPVFRLNGMVDGISAGIILEHEKFYGDQMALVEISGERVIDIDTAEELEQARYYLKRHYAQ